MSGRDRGRPSNVIGRIGHSENLIAAVPDLLAGDIDRAVARQMLALREKGVLQKVDTDVAAVIFQHGMFAAMEIMDAQGAEIPESTS